MGDAILDKKKISKRILEVYKNILTSTTGQMILVKEWLTPKLLYWLKYENIFFL